MDRPDNAITLTTYEQLTDFADAFADGKFNLLIIVGPPGIQKSRMMQATLAESPVCWIGNHATGLGLHVKAFEYCDAPIVIDDVDGLYADKAAVRLLKQLCQTERVKTLDWQSRTRILDELNVPRSFETRSRVCLIANEWRTLNVNVAAVQDRGQTVFLEFSAAEIHRKVGADGWFTDREIYNWIGESLALIPNPSMRHYVRAKELKEAGMDWQRLMLNQWLPDAKLRTVAELLMLPEHAGMSMNRRAKEFAERTGHTERTFWNLKKKLPQTTPRLSVFQ